MKSFVLIAFLVATSGWTACWSQEWRDSLNRARELYKSGNYREALKYYKSADRLAPNDVDLSEEKGQSAYRAGDYQEAEAAYNEAVSRQTNTTKRSSAYNNLGSARMKQQNYAGAEEAFKQALRENPSNEKARQHLAEVKRLREQQKKQQQTKNNQQQNNSNGGNDRQQSQQSDSQQQSSNQSQSGQNHPQQSSSGQQQQSQQGSTTVEKKLSDKQTERKLNELMRQEMEAKKRLDGSKGKTNGTKAKKDW